MKEIGLRAHRFRASWPRVLPEGAGATNPRGLLSARFSDRVTRWMTLNEPQVFVGMGHLSGQLAPGDRLAFPEGLGSLVSGSDRLERGEPAGMNALGMTRSLNR